MAPLSISHFVMQLKLHHFEYRVGFIFDKEKGFVMSRVRSKADGRRTVQSLMKFSLIGRSFESAQFKLQRPSTLKNGPWSKKTDFGKFWEFSDAKSVWWRLTWNFQLTNIPSMSNSISNNSTATNVTNQSQGSPDKLQRLKIESVLRALVKAWLVLIPTPVWIHVQVWQVR